MNNLTLSCTWTVSERAILPISRREIWVPRLTRKNLFTTYGLTALAGAVGGNYVAPIYLAIENFNSPLTASISAGATSFSVGTRVDQAGDTQIVLDVGSPSQEVVTFSAVTGSGPYTYTLTTPTVYAHSSGAAVVRQVSANDTLANVTTEVQYDSLNFPGQRLPSASGYSTGTGQYTIQFYYTSTMAVTFFATCGLTDSPSIGQGNLHNHFVLGYDHASGTSDVQINGNVTLVNS